MRSKKSTNGVGKARGGIMVGIKRSNNSAGKDIGGKEDI